MCESLSLYLDEHAEDIVFLQFPRDLQGSSTNIRCVSCSLKAFRLHGLRIVINLLRQSHNQYESPVEMDNVRRFEQCLNRRDSSLLIRESCDTNEVIIVTQWYDDSQSAPPFETDDRVAVSLNTPKGEFCDTIMWAFRRTRRVKWVDWYLRDARAFCDVYQEREDNRCWWCEWMLVYPCKGQGPAVIPWADPIELNAGSLRESAQSRAYECMKSFTSRTVEALRGRTVDARVIDEMGLTRQKRVTLLTQKKERSRVGGESDKGSGSIIVRVYNYLLHDQEQAPSGEEIVASLSEPASAFGDKLLLALSRCEVEE